MSDVGLFGPRYHLPFERRRAYLDRVDEAVIKKTRVSGFEKVVGTGETSTEVAFPVWFTERPSMSFGAELDENDFAEDTKFPTVSVVVLSWNKNLTERIGGGYWVGATLAIVTNGRAYPTQRFVVHWQAEGRAIRNPALESGGTDDAL